MEHLGFLFQPKHRPPLNLIGVHEMQDRINSERGLWTIVKEMLQLEAFRQLEVNDQVDKSGYRLQLQKTTAVDLQEKIKELQERIQTSREYDKLRHSLEQMTGGILKREIQIYTGVAKSYESTLKELVSKGEAVIEQKTILSRLLQLQTSIVPEVSQFLVNSFCERNFVLEGLFAMFGADDNQIEDLFGLLMTLKNSINHLDHQIAAATSEVNHAEFLKDVIRMCTRFSNVKLSTWKEEKTAYKESICNCILKEKVAIYDTKKIIDNLELSLNNLDLSFKLKEDSLLLNRTNHLLNEFSTVMQKWIKASTTLEQLNLDLVHCEAEVSNDISVFGFFSTETINGIVALKQFMETTTDENLSSNYYGFVYEHLKFSDKSIGNQIFPEILDHLCTAVFRTMHAAQKVLKHLPKKNVRFLILPLDSTFSDEDESPPKLPPNYQPLVELIEDHQHKTIFQHLFKSYFYTKTPQEQCPQLYDVWGITIFYLHDNITVCTDDGRTRGGSFPDFDCYQDSLEACIRQSLEMRRIKQKLVECQHSVRDYEKRIDMLIKSFINTQVDSIDRFYNLHKLEAQWDKVPILLRNLTKQRMTLARLGRQMEAWNYLLTVVEKERFNKRASYELQIAKCDQTISTRGREIRALEMEYDRKLCQMKYAFWQLRERLTYVGAFDGTLVSSAVHRALENVSGQCMKMLSDAMGKIDVKEPNYFAIADQLDLLKDASVNIEIMLFNYNERLRELDLFNQELSNLAKKRFKNLRMIKMPKDDRKLSQLYTFKKSLNHSQPGYRDSELEAMKMKLSLLETREKFISNCRTTFVSNMILPCVEKICWIKLRYITELMLKIPLKIPSGGLKLIFLYDQSQCPAIEQQNLHTPIFTAQHMVGMRFVYVDQNDQTIRLLGQNDAVLVNLLFFVTFLAMEGCRFLMVHHCFEDLSDENMKYLERYLKALIGNRMQLVISRDRKD
ncbi:uncharacterized protein LOC129760791 [Uranotaenia lowii]|uniref:uncharacterized protein LOC129760791 n=1 Tax=Uranotaenia lowii TaxID=190385 RepID=UPI002479DD5E|nr:uncharacterized protein LOC129760791 [Uranotaenia lowii]